MITIVNEWVDLFKGFHKGLIQYVKYQIIMLFMFSIILMPIFEVASETLLRINKVPAVSNRLLLEYIFSFKGMIFAVALFLVLLLGIVLEIGGLTLISIQQIGHYTEKSSRGIFMYCLKKMPHMLEAGSLLIVLYFAVLTPFIGLGPTLSFLYDFEMPEFIESFLYDRLVIQVLLSTLSLIMLLFILKGIFVFHFILYRNLKPNQAIRESARLVNGHKWIIAKEVFILAMLTTGLIVTVSWGWGGFIQFLIGLLDPSSVFTKGLMVALLTLQDMGILIFGLLFIPFEIYHFTHIYLHIDSNESKKTEFDAFFVDIPPSHGLNIFNRMIANKLFLIVIGTGVLFVSAIPGGLFFDEWFRAEQDIAVIAHRGGGYSAPENSLEGIAAAIKMEADWTELDIQRAPSGAYILNHDSIEMGKVYPLLEDALKLAKGKIKLNLELKGDTADTKMVDEILKMIDSLNMKDEVMLSCVDHSIIEFIEKLDHQVTTGIIYVFALGDVSGYTADIIIMEAQQLSEDVADSIHKARKKVFVWTVNDPDSLWSLVRQDVDGIITDEINLLHQTIEERDQESDEDLLYSIFFDW